MTLVLDAGAAVHALIPSSLGPRVIEVLRGEDILSPGLVDTEVLSALARLERAGEISREEADAAVVAWERFPCQRVPTTALIAEIWRLRSAVRVADGHYLALAAAVRGTVVTADARLARAGVGGVSMLVVG